MTNIPAFATSTEQKLASGTPQQNQGNPTPQQQNQGNPKPTDNKPNEQQK